MVVSYMIPLSDSAHQNIIDDAPALYNLNQTLLPNDFTTRFDIFTDSIILSELLYYDHNESVVDNAMLVYGTIRGKDFQRFIEGDMNVIHEYPRYWHGYLFVYKILFNLFDYTTIKVLELAFELVLCISIIKLMVEKGLKKYVVPFILSVLAIHPEVIGLSMHYFPVFNITLVSVFMMLEFNEELFKNDSTLYYFMIIGMATSFFDFLTYPLVSLGIPLVFYIILENDNSSLKCIIKKIILFSALWAVGYVGMWFAKLVIASIILNENVILNGLNRFMVRSSDLEFSRLNAILVNISLYNKKIYVILIGAVAVYYLKRLVDVRESITLDNLKRLLPFMLIALIPFSWYFLASNHSSIHNWSTYRELFIFFFALLCSLEYIIAKSGALEDSKSK